eukprot:SAG31_NODE_20760_length_566_cov_0.631692_1_plen_74_part_10
MSAYGRAGGRAGEEQLFSAIGRFRCSPPCLPKFQSYCLLHACSPAAPSRAPPWLLSTALSPPRILAYPFRCPPP